MPPNKPHRSAKTLLRQLGRCVRAGEPIVESPTELNATHTHNRGSDKPRKMVMVCFVREEDEQLCESLHSPNLQLDQRATMHVARQVL